MHEARPTPFQSRREALTCFGLLEPFETEPMLPTAYTDFGFHG